MKVLLIDDHAPIRRGIRQLLEMRPDFEVVGEGSNGAEAVEQVDQLHPDIVLMDMNMPVMNGAEATAVIKERHPEVQVVGLTAFGDMALVTAMVKAGAAGYLLKGGAPQELIDSLYAVARGGGALDREVTRAVMDDMAELYKKEAHAYAELDRMKSEFVAIVSHELRTPLTSIKGGAHTLKRGWGTIDDHTRLEFLDSITRQCNRLSQMIEKILTVSGIQRGGLGLGLTPKAFSLAEAAREAVALLAGKIAGRDLHLDLSEVDAAGDPERTRDVASSLIDNALSFTSGRVSVVTGRADDEADDEADDDADKKSVYLIVADEGPGIDSRTLARLLEAPFVQADSSSTRAVGGLGLSLYVARRVVEASGGRLDVETSPHSGTSIKMVLPTPEA